MTTTETGTRSSESSEATTKHFARAKTLVCLLTLALASAAIVPAQQTSASGSVVGCVSDNTGQMLPGTTVTAKNRTDQRTAESASNGCYELKELPPGSYRVTARLTGFDNVTRDRVEVRRSSVTRLDLRTQASPICECVRLGGTLAELAAGADAVLYVRLKESEPVPSTPQGYYRHSASVLRAVKEASGARTSLVFVLQNQRSGTPSPYDVGQELVAFLKSSGSLPSDAFTILNDEPGLAVPTGSHTPSIAFLVEDGRIQQAPGEFSRYVGMSIDSFLAELRVLLRRK